MTTHSGAQQETQTWWRASGTGRARIDSFEVVRFTDDTVSYLTPGEHRPRRGYISSSDWCWFRTEAEAIIFQRERLDDGVRRCARILDNALSKVAAFNEAHPLTQTVDT